jgi:hypothetical protein
VTVASQRSVPARLVLDVVNAAKAAGFDTVRAEVLRDDFRRAAPPQPRPAIPTRKQNVGGDGPPGGEFHVNLVVGETVRVNVWDGRQNDPIPVPPDFLQMSADAEGLIVTGLKPGVTRVTVRDTKGRDFTIRIAVEHLKP